MILRTDHIGIVVEDFDAALAFVTDVLALELQELIDVRDTLGARVAFFSCGEVSLEIIDPPPADRDRRLDGKTARIEHVALEVDDIVATAEELNSSGGVAFTAEQPQDFRNKRLLFTDAATSGGIEYQLIEYVDSGDESSS